MQVRNPVYKTTCFSNLQKVDFDTFLYDVQVVLQARTQLFWRGEGVHFKPKRTSCQQSLKIYISVQ